MKKSRPPTAEKPMQDRRTDDVGNIRLFNNTQRTVWTCTSPNATPGTSEGRLKQFGAVVDIVGLKLDAQPGMTIVKGGASTDPLLAQHTCLSAGEKSIIPLGRGSYGTLVWYTVDELTPSGLQSGKFEQYHPPPAQALIYSSKATMFGYDVARLEELHGYVVDQASGEFVKKSMFALQRPHLVAPKTYPRLKIVRIRHIGTIFSGVCLQMNQVKLSFDGLKDVVLEPGKDVQRAINLCLYSRTGVSTISSTVPPKVLGARQMDEAERATDDGVKVGDGASQSLTASERRLSLVEEHDDDLSASGDTAKLSTFSDSYGLVETRVAHDESALMDNVKLVNKVYKEDFTVRGERATYVIDPVIEGPGCRQFSGASIRYFVGYYGDLTLVDMEEERPYEAGVKQEMGLLAVQTYLPVVKPDGPSATCDLPWEVDGDFEAIWNGDGLWVETPLKHFSRPGIARLLAYVLPNRGDTRSGPPQISPFYPISPGETVENGPLRASKKFKVARIVQAQNCTEETVYWCTIPNPSPAEEVPKSNEIEGGGNVGPVEIHGRRSTSSTTKREATKGATSTSALGKHNCLGPGTMDTTSLGGHGSATIIWYTLNELTPAQLTPGLPLKFGYDHERLQEDYGYVIDATSGKFVKQPQVGPEDSPTYSRLQFVRIYYNGNIHPGWYSRLHQGKLTEGGIKDFFVPFSVDVDAMLNEHYATKTTGYS